MSADNRPVSPDPARAAEPVSATPLGATPTPSATAQAVGTGPYPQAAFAYPAETSVDAQVKRSRGKRMALFIAGAAVVGALLFGGGFWTGTVVISVPGMSDGRFGDGPRRGPDEPRDLGRVPDTNSSPDTSLFAG